MNVIANLPSDLGGGKSGYIGPMGKLKIGNESGNKRYQCIVALQGTNGIAFGTFIISGYGDGTNVRHHFVKLLGSDALNVSIDGRFFYINWENSMGDISYNIIPLLGEIPDTVESCL